MQLCICAVDPVGAGARKMQRWWPSNKSDQQGFVWTEMAVRLLSPDGADAAQRVRSSWFRDCLATVHSPAATGRHE
jgi:hypothetical protein